MLKFITGNKTKVKEASAVLAPLEIEQVDIDLAEIQELDPHIILKHKLKEAFKELSPALPFSAKGGSASMILLSGGEKGGSGPTPLFSKEGQGEFIIEDTSFYMEALGYKLPGPLIKWFLQSIDKDGLVEIAEKFAKFGARATTIIAYASSPDNIEFFEGTIEGTMVRPRGEYAFGFDYILVPNGYTETLSELKAKGDFSISARALAMEKLKIHLLKNYQVR